MLASPPPLLGATQRFGSFPGGGTQPLDIHGASSLVAEASSKSPNEADKAPSQRARVDVAHEAALHDDFFDAGEQGMYEGGHGADSSHHVLDDELEHDVPRLVVRTPEQERRRNKMMQYVGVVVGVVLGIFMFAMLKGRGSSAEETKPATPTRPTEHALTPPTPVEPPAPPAVAPPPPPPPPEPEAVTPPPAPAAVEPAPEEKPHEKPPVAAHPDQAVLPGPVAASASRRPPQAEPVSHHDPLQPQPRPAAPTTPAPPPLPAGKPPTVSFPD